MIQMQFIYQKPGGWKFLWMLAGCASLASVGHAQDSRALVNVLLSHWRTSKAMTLAVAQAMPDKDYTFKAAPKELSFGEQMSDIAGGNENFCSAALGTKGPFEKVEAATKAVALKNLTTPYDFCIEGVQKMTDAKLMQLVGTAPRQATVFERFWGGFTHAAHHRGQAEIYLRLKGIAPPPYKF
jgi:DinB family